MFTRLPLGLAGVVCSLCACQLLFPLAADAPQGASASSSSSSTSSSGGASSLAGSSSSAGASSSQSVANASSATASSSSSGAGASSATAGASSSAAASSSAGASSAASASSTGGASSSSAASSSSSGQPAGTVSLWVAIGKFGRITTSCDEGRTWVFNRSDDDGGNCVGLDCDHHPGSSTGITFGGGAFYASFGWGDNPSRIMRSTNGIDWQTVYDVQAFSFAGLAWGQGRLFGGDASPRYSLDDGVSFMDAAWPDYQVPGGAWPNARSIAFGGGQVLLISGSGDTSWGDTTISSDLGLTYTHPTVLPEGCRGYSRPPVYDRGTWLQLWSGTLAACHSSNSGDTWVETHPFDPMGGEISNAVSTGTEFVVYQGNRGFRTADGSSWSAFDSNQRVGVLGHNPATGTYVMTQDSWGQPYTEQRFHRSTDGITWEQLPLSAFVQSHPITHILSGYGSPSTTCPLP